MTLASSNNYLLKTGNNDYTRLAILNKLYNPLAIYFLQMSGVKIGMTILEIGCGTGHMACELAQLVGDTGKVIAIDNSPAQIEVAKITAEQAGVKNIEFLVHDMRELGKLDYEYDATYGRWTIEFSEDPAKILADLYRYLKPGGILAYEASNTKQTQFFSSPTTPLIEQWHTIGSKLFASANYNTEFGVQAYHEFKKLGCCNIKTLVNQAMLQTPEEKSVYRLGMYAATPLLLAKNILTQAEIDDICRQCEILEASDVICGFFKNILVSGVKQ